MERVTLSRFVVSLIIGFLAFQPVVVTNGEISDSEHNAYVQGLADVVRPHRDRIRNLWLRWENPQDISPLDDAVVIDCDLCKGAMPLVRLMSNVQPESVKKIAVSVCNLLDLAPPARRPEICQKTIDNFADTILHIIKNTNGSQVCGHIAPNCEDAAPVLKNWTIKIEGKKPSDEELDKMRGTIPADVKTTKIIQFTDIHMDLHYKEGMNADCGEGIPVCCRESDGPATNESMKGGKYGHWRCALPLLTLEEMYKNARDNHSDAKYIFMTGDYIHSQIWLYTRDENEMHFRNATEKMTEVYQNVPKNKTKIYPLTGNHEPNVVNQYPPPELWDTEGFDISWVYNSVLDAFMERDPDLLPPEEEARFRKWGYYSVAPEPGLRLIALNTNLGYMENFWIGYQLVDPGDHLQWLADNLNRSEKAGEKVIIIGHEEPGSCWRVWSDKFNQIVDRYEGIIKGQFYGHSHKPQYRVGFRKGTFTPMSNSFISGSALTDYMNPTYSVFHFDGERGGNSTWDVVKQELIILKLLESNKQLKPIFEKLVDSSTTFGLKDLTPKSLLEFGKKMMCDQDLLDKYMIYHSRGTDTPAYRQCQLYGNCAIEHICNFVSSNAMDSYACDVFKDRIGTRMCDDVNGNGAMGNFNRDMFTFVWVVLISVFLPH